MSNRGVQTDHHFSPANIILCNHWGPSCLLSWHEELGWSHGILSFVIVHALCALRSLHNPEHPYFQPHTLLIFLGNPFKFVSWVAGLCLLLPPWQTLDLVSWIDFGLMLELVSSPVSILLLTGPFRWILQLIHCFSLCRAADGLS